MIVVSILHKITRVVLLLSEPMYIDVWHMASK